MKRQRWKRFLAAILTTVMCLGEVGGTGMKVFAQDDIPSTEEAVSEDDAASENEAVSEEEPGLETPAEEPADTPKEEQEEGSEEEPDADGDTYALWVGGVQVTDKNKDDIPGVTGGKASYDPVTKTLEFQNAVVETYYAEGADRNDAIAAWNDDLTIRGKLTIVKGTGAYGIVADGNLRLEDADITVPEAEYSAIRVMKGLEIVRSSLNVKSADEYAVWVNGDVTLDDSYIKAEGTSFGFLCQGKINPANKHEVLQPAGAEIDKYGQIARGGADSRVIEIVRDYEVYVGETPVTKLNNRNVLGDGKVSYDPEKNTLRLEGAEITSVSVQGKNKYKTNIYSASDLRIEGSVKMSAEANRWIWSAGSLTLDAEIEGTKAVTLVYAGESMQVIGGEIKGTSQRGGLTANQELTIDGGNITLTVGESGLYTVMGAVVINGGDIKLSCPEDSHAVVAGSGRGKFTMNGGRLYAKTDNVGALWAGELSITKNDMRILLPEGGYEKGGSIIDPKTGNSARELLICKKGTQDCTVSFDMGGHGTQIPPKTVKDGTVLSRPDDPSATGWIFAGWYSDDRYKSKFDFTKEILKDTTIYAKWIENKESYELWLGNKLVGGDNCLDIFKDGKASYDPTTNTLTLSGYTGAYSAGQIADFVPYSEQAGGYKPLIYAKQDLTIKGSATLTSSSGANIGIMSEQGKLSIDADLKLNIENETDGGAYGLYCQAKDLNIAGGSVEVNAGGGANAVGLAVGNADVVIDGGNVKTTGTMVGVFTMGGNVVLGGGSLEAVGTGSESIGVANFAGTVTLNAGTLKAKGVKAAAVFTTMVKDEDYFETKPGDVKILKDPGMGANTFFEADGTTIAKEVELTRKMFTVTFDLGGKTVYDGTAPEPQKVYAGKTAHKPEDPVAEGFAFKGWYKDQACTEEFSFLGTDITEDITLYAKWAEGFTVEFNTGYDDVDEPFAQSVEEGNTVERPGDPVAEGRKFLGWFLSLEDTEPYDFDTPVTKSFTLYAKWEKEKRTVSFDANGHGAAPAAITVDYGDVPEAPEEPKAEGYKFMGWYLDKECKALYDFGQPVTEDLTLYAKWVDAATKTWTVSFSLNGMAGTAPAAQTVEDGGLAIRPEDPVVPGRTFAGWYTGKSCKDEELFSFATPITADITLYAKWVGGGEEIPGFTVWFVGCAPGPEYGSLAYNSVNGHYEVAYTSFAMKPAVEVRGADGVILTEGTDYTVKYSNNVNVSTKKAAKVTVKGKGNFSGSKELEFYILPADLSILKGKLIVVPQQYAKDGKPVAELYYGTYKLKAKDVELPKEKITEAKELE
nr:InlB B-repeat-containing protein [Lachnospiraceae bacterium]